ncbi:histidinol dehydrogenase [Sphingomonas sp. Leaf17]|uniref:histidinol dehydrogenase n=1 Tax=Sphingomonas sp. Leaf17 TaxID=1735683 RepID=UPI0006F87FA0|nr:histidinol dehydrogenase [Sphingomonas sp. Leaf17]KQM67475.1 histidinol dehydrogenase [Sphingomonas sp. Leaf17]
MIRLSTTDAGFAEAFDALVNDRRESDSTVTRDVAAIIARVRAEGEGAVRDLTLALDRHDLDATGWQVDLADCKAAFERLEPELRIALELAATRIRAYHEKQLPVDSDFTDAAGVRLGARWRPVDAAGLYVPGGRAAYPSSLLMNAIPAKVAGVGRIAMVTPTPDGKINHLVLAAAHLAGVDEIWRIGGAQGVAALAHGAGRIAAVDVITGPGNAWVAEAKRQLYGVVGIDMVAGPSEIVVLADGLNDSEWTAADLLSQAEHDVTTQSILFTDDADFADRVAAAVDRQIPELATANVARVAWDANGAIIVVRDLDEAMPLVDRLAPEHLQLSVDAPQTLFDRVRHAGSVFLGRHTPEAIGDYVAGPNHVLPTGRRARFASGLSVLDFMKRTSFLGLTEDSLRELGPATVALARAEGLPAHAKSVALRLRLND